MNLVRNALCVQQISPNGFELVSEIMLSIYVMFPVIKETGLRAGTIKLEFDSIAKIKEVAQTLQEQIQGFLKEHTNNVNKSFFVLKLQVSCGQLLMQQH